MNLNFKIVNHFINIVSNSKSEKDKSSSPHHPHTTSHQHTQKYIVNHFYLSDKFVYNLYS